jgi:hypothetical protein
MMKARSMFSMSDVTALKGDQKAHCWSVSLAAIAGVLGTQR